MSSKIERSIEFDCAIFCVFDFVRLPNSVELNPRIEFDRVRLNSIEIQLDCVRLTMLGLCDVITI